MGKFISRLAAALGMATKAEKQEIANQLDAALAASGPVTGRISATEPNTQSVPRQFGKVTHHRMRDRNTEFSRRQPAQTPREIHANANHKGVQFISNPLLTSLLYRDGVFDVSYPSQNDVHDSRYEVLG